MGSPIQTNAGPNTNKGKERRSLYWGYIKAMIRYYPQRREQYIDAMAQSETPAYSGMPQSSEVSRVTENVVVKTLSGKNGITEVELKEYEAVHTAIKKTEEMRHGDEIIEMIRLMYWLRKYGLHDMEKIMHISYQTAKRWHHKFLELVAENYGF